jgi:hypothetical protein
MLQGCTIDDYDKMAYRLYCRIKPSDALIYETTSCPQVIDELLYTPMSGVHPDERETGERLLTDLAKVVDILWLLRPSEFGKVEVNLALPISTGRKYCFFLLSDL